VARELVLSLTEIRGNQSTDIFQPSGTVVPSSHTCTTSACEKLRGTVRAALYDRAHA
jgi:hypothetical protein